MILFHAFTIICLLLGLFAITLAHPGTGLNIDPASLNTSSISYLTTTSKFYDLFGFRNPCNPHLLRCSARRRETCCQSC